MVRQGVVADRDYLHLSEAISSNGSQKWAIVLCIWCQLPMTTVNQSLGLFVIKGYQRLLYLLEDERKGEGDREPKAVWDWIIQPIHLRRGCHFHLPRDLQEWQDLPGRQDTLGSLSDWETWGWKADSVSPKWNAPTEISQGETRNTSTEMEWHDLHGCQSWEHPDFVGVPNILVPSMPLEAAFLFSGSVWRTTSQSLQR